LAGIFWQEDDKSRGRLKKNEGTANGVAPDKPFPRPRQRRLSLEPSKPLVSQYFVQPTKATFQLCQHQFGSGPLSHVGSGDHQGQHKAQLISDNEPLTPWSFLLPSKPLQSVTDMDLTDCESSSHKLGEASCPKAVRVRTTRPW